VYFINIILKFSTNILLILYKYIILCLFSESSGRLQESLISRKTQLLLIKYRNSMNNNNVTIDCHIMLNATIPNFGAVKNTFEMSFKKVYKGSMLLNT